MLEVKNKKSIKFQVDLRPEYAYLIGLLKNKREFVEKLLVRTALNDKDEFYKPFSAPNEVANEIVKKYYQHSKQDEQVKREEQVKQAKRVEIAETEKAKRIEVAEQEQEQKQEIKIEAIDIKKQVARPQLNIASFD